MVRVQSVQQISSVTIKPSSAAGSLTVTDVVKLHNEVQNFATNAAASAQDALSSANVALEVKEFILTNEKLDTIYSNIEQIDIVSRNIDAINAANNNIQTAQDCANNAAASAQNALNSANVAANNSEDARIWAEGTDEEVNRLGGLHSAKGWGNAISEIHNQTFAIRRWSEVNE